MVNASSGSIALVGLSDESVGQPDHDGCNHHQRSIVDRAFLVAGGDAPPLLEPIDAAFHHVAPLVDRRIEGRTAPGRRARLRYDGAGGDRYGTLPYEALRSTRERLSNGETSRLRRRRIREK